MANHEDTLNDLDDQVRALLAEHDPIVSQPRDFLAARFDAGLAWLHFEPGCGGQGVSQLYQARVDEQFAAVGAPTPGGGKNLIGMNMGAPTIATFGTDSQKQTFLRPLYVGDHVYCQLFSEPGAGSDLAAVAARAVRDGTDWIINGQKVWTSVAQHAQMALLLARTDPGVPKHKGLTYFLCDMSLPGIEVRPLRQLTGEAEFNEVFLSDVRVPDDCRLGAEGDGWKVATTTLSNERVSYASTSGGVAREAGMIGKISAAWRDNPALRDNAMHDELLRLWVESEVFRLTGERMRQRLAAGQPGPEGSGVKLAFARLAQAISGLEVQLRGESGLRYDDWTMRDADNVDFIGREAGYRYLRARGNSIEGGTSEIQRNIIAERILMLPTETRTDKDVAWKDLVK